MKILLLKFGRIINAAGGMEKVFFDMANNFNSRGHNVFCIGYENKIGEPFFNIDDGVTFINAGFNCQDKNWLINLKSFFISTKKQEIKKDFLSVCKI